MNLFSKYHQIVLGLYVAVIGFSILFLPEVFQYQVLERDYWLVGLLIGILLLSFIWTKNKWLFGYALLFAVPEEIIFRGVIQSWLSQWLNVYYAILVASIIFGLAHSFNRASGWKPKNWNWRLIGITFLAGIILGGNYYWASSLWLPTILHAIMIIIYTTGETDAASRS